MSDSYIDLIPTDPSFVPTEAARADAVALARDLFPAADAVELVAGDHVALRDCGANFEAVTCPSCGADLLEAWGALMERDFDGDGFTLRPHELECCGISATLNDLVYESPQGFSRTVLSVRNPDVAEVAEAELGALGRAIGSSMRAIFRHL